MGFVQYHGDIAKFWLEIENFNIHARVSGIAWRKMIEDQIHEDALRGLSLREYINDGELLEAVSNVTTAEDDFTEHKGHRGGGPSGKTWGEKRKFEDSKPTVTAKCVKKQSMAKEKADYQRKKAGERRVKKEGSVAPAREVKHRV